LNGQSFADFIRKHFEELFRKSGKLSNLWLQDGDPSQNSKKSKQAQEDVGAHLFSIPPRSPELNPIENVFSFVKKELRLQVLEHQLERESYEHFSLRVKATLLSTSTLRVNSIIESYGQRLSQIIVKKGGRINY
jgi:transposase